MSRAESLAIAEGIVRQDSRITQSVAIGPDTCLRCGQPMVMEVRENIEFRNCSCGYGSRTSSGHGTMAWQDTGCLR